MSGTHRAQRGGWTRRRPLQAFVVAGALLLGVTSGLGTLAYWNDVETVTGGTVTAGSLDLTVEDTNGVAVGQWNQLTLATIAPGESVAAALTVRNVGTTPFTVAVAASGTGLLLPAVDVAVASGVAPVTTSPTYPRGQTCGVAIDRPLSGSPTWDVAGTVQPGGSVQVCVRLALRVTADNTLQGKTITPSFTLTATQVQP
ncbi:TasA family protein [Nocardioides salarius]|uniref:TasA family protein n=1 Tax=Nocardioides salarius TaxID=374513 RepID=UPI0030FA2965